MITFSRYLAGCGLFIGLLSFWGGSNASVISTYTERADLKSAIFELGLQKRTKSFNRVKGVRKGGQRSFASQPLRIGDLSMAMEAEGSAAIPEGKRNRVTKRPRFRVNQTKYAWVKTAEGVNLVMTFDAPVYAFGAKFRGLNNDLASMSIMLDGGAVGQLEPPKTSNGKRSFFGFVSDVAFTSITFSGKDAFGMDKLIYGMTPAAPSIILFTPLSTTELGGELEKGPQSAAASVPAPAPLLLVGFAIIGLGTTRFIRRQVIERSR